MKIIKPKALKYGSTLGIIATGNPISICGDSTIARGYEFLRSKGFKIVEADCCRKNVGHTAGTIDDRVKDLHSLFANPEIDGILTFWGGYNTHQILEYLDYDLIKNNPKALIGYSDVTSLQIALLKETGLVTFSGPAGITFAKPVVPEFTWNHFKNVLIESVEPLSIENSDTYSDNEWWLEADQKMHFETSPKWTTFRKGRATGRIIAGNAGTLLLLSGTKYWPQLDNCILFLEEDETETTHTIDRKWTQLRHAGVFEKIAGLAIGRFSRKVNFNANDTFEMILNDSLKGYNFPTMTNIDFGHTDPLITIPNGINCELDATNKTITFLEKAVH